MCDYTKDIKFIEKRLDEQHNYLEQIIKTILGGYTSKSRFQELYISSLSQLIYFELLKEQYYESENKLPTVYK